MDHTGQETLQDAERATDWQPLPEWKAWGFGLAGIGMVLGLAIFLTVLTINFVGDPSSATDNETEERIDVALGGHGDPPIWIVSGTDQAHFLRQAIELEVVGTLAAGAGPKVTYICGFSVSAVGTGAVGPITIAGIVTSSMIFQAASAMSCVSFSIM